MKLHDILFRLTANRPMRLIQVNGEAYLERYHIAHLFGRSIWLHRFVRDDAERHVHDHPWSALSVILTGGYDEEVMERRQLLSFFYTDLWTNRHQAPGLNWIPASKKHRISSVIPGTWSLMLVGKRHGGGWHFYQGAKKYQPFASTSEDWWRTAGNREQVYAARQSA